MIEIKEIITLAGDNGMLLLELQSYETTQEPIIIQIDNDNLFDWLPSIVDRCINIRKEQTKSILKDIEEVIQ